MKRLFLALALANVVLLVWLLANPLPDPRQPLPPLPEGVAPLRLAPPETHSPPAGTVEPAVAEVVPDTPPPAEPVAEVAAGSGQPGAMAEVGSEGALSGPLCLRGGPFPPKEGERLSEALAGRGVVVHPREVEIDEPRYWVFVPPAADLKAAFALAERLREAGIRDLQVIPGGAKRNAISLGLYRNAAIARERQGRIRDLGFDVFLEETSQKVTRLQLELPVPDEFVDAAGEWAEGLSLPEGITWRLEPCAEPASPQE